MNPGTVLFDRNFVFHDGEIGRKLLIVLNDGSCGYYIAVKTTSQPKRKSQASGCQLSDRPPNYFLPVRSSFLKENTWLILDEYYELEKADLLSKRFSQILEVKGELALSLILGILNCAITSDDITKSQEQVLAATLQSLEDL